MRQLDNANAELGHSTTENLVEDQNPICAVTDYANAPAACSSRLSNCWGTHTHIP